MRLIDLTGKKYGQWRVIKRAPTPEVNTRAYWICECACGKERTVSGTGLRSGGTTRCADCAHIKHGLSGTSECGVYRDLRARCNNLKHKSYKSYGGRGVKDKYGSLKAFVKDVGPRPSSKHSIERKDNNGSYEPGNCEWALISVQVRNRRTNRYIEAFGEVKVVADWVADNRCTVSHQTICRRLDDGWSPEDAVQVPPRGARDINNSRQLAKRKGK